MTEIRKAFGRSHRHRVLLYAALVWLLAIPLEPAAGEEAAQADGKPAGPELRPVKVVGSWASGFQFAGIFSAIEADLYRDVGLDVQVDVEEVVINPVAAVVEGRAAFGIWNPELLVRRASGQKVVVLAAIYQHSPMVVLTRRDSGLATPQDLAGKRILFSPRQGALEIEAMFRAEGVDPGDLVTVDASTLSGDWTAALLAGEYDAKVDFLPRVKSRHPDFREIFNVIEPVRYGIDFYGDCLFTSEKLAKEEPELVAEFLEATLYGWQYAMAHQEAAAELLNGSYCPMNSIESLLVEAKAIEGYIPFRQIEIGHMNRGRWQGIAATYQAMGAMSGAVDLDEFLWDPTAPAIKPVRRNSSDGEFRPLWAVVAILASALVGVSIRLAQLRRRLAAGRVRDHAATPVPSPVGGKYRDKEEFRQEIQRMGAAMWDWNISPSRLNITDEFIEFTGYSLDDLGPHPAAHLRMIHPAERTKAREHFIAYLDGKRPDCEFEFRFLFPNGEYRWVKSRVVAFWDEDGKPARVVGSLMDISERVNAEEERDRLFNLSLDMLAVGGYDGFLQQVNPAWVRVLGWSRDDLMAEPILVFIHVEDQDVFEEALRKLEEGQIVEDLQCRFRCRDNTYKWLSWSSFSYPENRSVFSVVRDITSQKEAQFKLRESQERLRSLSNQMSLVEDRQRRQLAEAIHDGLAQQLFGVRALVTLLRYPEKLDDMQQVVTDIFQVLDETMTEARSLSFELFPAELQEVGLEAALGWMANEFQERNGIRCQVQVEKEGPELSEDLRAMAYQCVRELFNNVKKHAAATEIRIALNYVDRYLTIVVADNGRGFELSEGDSQESRKLEYEGFGLFSIRERIRSVGGRMLVDSRLGKGCRVFLSFPLDQTAS